MNSDWEFMEMILKELPSNIFFKDTECRYLFATHYWNHIEHDESEEWTIRGKTDLEIRKDKENAAMAYKQDKRILETGEGCQYVIEVCLDGNTEYLEVIKNPVRNKENQIIGIVGLINNVTDRILMEKQLERYAQTDGLTGLFNRHYLDQWMDLQMGLQQYPVSVISADCDGLKKVNDTFGHEAGDEMIRRTAQLFRVQMPEKAVLFRTGGDEFLMILPDTGEEETQQFVERLENEASKICIEGETLSVSYGVCVMRDGSDDIKAAIRTADQNMYHEKERKKRTVREK